MTVLSPDLPSQTLARKRRMEILASQKKVNKRHRIIAESEDDNDDTRDDASVPGTTSTCTTVRSKSTKRNQRKKKSLACTGRVIKSDTKYQNRYEPEVPMTKEQEAEWRKEARKQRNRESAAASRNKVRNRIIELENEVEGWKAKYMALMQRLDALEKATPFPSTTRAVPATPETPKNIYIPSTNAPSCPEDRGHNDLSIPTIPSLTDSSISYDDTTNPGLSMSSSLSSQQQQHPHPQQIYEQNATNNVEDLHVIEITSRPAVKITDGGLLQHFVTNVNNEWNNVDVTELNNNGNENEVYDSSSAPVTENYWERLHFATLRSDGTEVQELEQISGEFCNFESTRSSSNGSISNLVQDALYDFDFNEADVERLLE